MQYSQRNSVVNELSQLVVPVEGVLMGWCTQMKNQIADAEEVKHG